MVQQLCCAKKTTDSECVYSSHPRTPPPSTANRRVICETDGGGMELKKKKKRVNKIRRFLRRLFCFPFAEEVEQSEKQEQDTEATPSIISPQDPVSLQDIRCSVEDCDDQEDCGDNQDDCDDHQEDCDDQEPPYSSPEVLPSPEEQLHPPVPERLSEGEVTGVSPLTDQLDNDVDTSTEDICSNYEIGNKLGEGGFGVVYAGIRPDDGLLVALKYAKKTEATEYINIPGQPKPVPMEIGLTVFANTGPSSPHIIKLLDWQDFPNHYIMVLQRPWPCMSLYEYVQRLGGIATEELARHVMHQVVEAANSCCSRGVFHRDIKESNILVNTDTLDVSLIDFGAGDLLFETAYSTFSGTMPYCPPEYFETGQYYARPATVFSLGVVLYSLVCGYLPDKSDQDKLRDWLWYLPSLTKDCSHLINACLHPDPEQRIQLHQLLLHDWFINV